MAEEFESQAFESDEDLMRVLAERCDDIDAIELMVVNDMPVVSPEGKKTKIKGVCAILRLCSDEGLVIHRDHLEAAINSGLFARLQIPFRLIPERAEGPTT